MDETDPEPLTSMVNDDHANLLLMMFVFADKDDDDTSNCDCVTQWVAKTITKS